MTPYYQDSAVTIYLGDCREILPTLGKVDVVVTDPPFNIPHHFGINKGSKNGSCGLRTMEFSWDKSLTVSDVVSACKVGATLAQSVFIFCGIRQASYLSEALFSIGMTDKPACWVKQCPVPAGLGNWWPSGFELAVYAYRSGAYFNDTNVKRSNVFYSDNYRHGQPGKEDHPTQKPLGLITRIVSAMVRPGGVALDPFMGSGTTLRAAKDLGRKAIGIEIEERYCEIAAKRMSQEVLAL